MSLFVVRGHLNECEVQHWYSSIMFRLFFLNSNINYQLLWGWIYCFTRFCCAAQKMLFNIGTECMQICIFILNV